MFQDILLYNKQIEWNKVKVKPYIETHQSRLVPNNAFSRLGILTKLSFYILFFSEIPVVKHFCF